MWRLLDVDLRSEEFFGISMAVLPSYVGSARCFDAPNGNTSIRIQKTPPISNQHLPAPLVLLGRGSTNQMKICLTPQCPGVGSVTVDGHVLLESHANALAVPLGHRRRGLKLDRKPHRWDYHRVTAARYSVLIIPEANERTGTMPVYTYRMRVDRSIDSLGTHPRK